MFSTLGIPVILTGVIMIFYAGSQALLDKIMKNRCFKEQTANATVIEKY